MLLEGKAAIVFGGGGSVGGAVARPFAHEGATVLLAGRSLEKLDPVADALLSNAIGLEDVQGIADDGGVDRASALTGTLINVTCGSRMTASDAAQRPSTAPVLGPE